MVRRLGPVVRRVTTMTRTVPLHQLPTGLEFPADIQHRIRYDSSQRQLAFDGFMSKTDFDRLARLHRDIQYQRALDRLFQICIIEPAAPERTNKRWLWWSIIVTALIAVVAVIVMFRR